LLSGPSRFASIYPMWGEQAGSGHSGRSPSITFGGLKPSPSTGRGVKQGKL
jgi:hypothetical protein